MQKMAARNENVSSPYTQLSRVWYVDEDAQYHVQKRMNWSSCNFVALRTLSGEGYLHTHNGEKFSVQANTLGIFAANSIAAYGVANNRWRFYWYEFDCSVLESDVLNQMHTIRLSGQEQRELERSFLCMRSGKNRESMLSEALFNLLLSDWLNNIYTSSSPSVDHQKILEILEQGRHAHLDISALAKEAGMCERSFRTAVHAATGRSPKEYMLDCEMSTAMNLLCTTKMPIGEIAACCNYANPLYFSRVFKKYYGIAPAYVRKYMDL